MGKFHWVDFAARYQKGFRNHIVSIDEVPQLVASFERYGCYATYFCYSDEVFSYLSTQGAAGTPSIAGFEGKVWAPFLPIDLDHPELTPAIEAARLLRDLFDERWSLDRGAYQVFFSGSKGFHIMLDSRVFGRVAPSQHLPMIFDAIRRHLAHELPEWLRDTVDLTIRDRVRLLRLPNTVHEKSGLYKVLIEPNDLDNLTANDIREYARQWRPLELTDETGLVARIEVAANTAGRELFQRVRSQVRRYTGKKFAYRFNRPGDIDCVQFACAGLEQIWQSHIAKGQRNNCAIRLASEFRLLGLTQEETESKLLDWNRRNEIGLPDDEIRSVTHSAYQHRFPYRYSCRDPIRRRFCPLKSYHQCIAYSQHATDNDSSK